MISTAAWRKPSFWLFAGFVALVYIRSLTFVYVEGDDATSIAYHALGRIRDLQPPYSAYQSMMDALLGLLPASEPVLRVCAMLLTSLGAPLLLLLIALLALDWAGDSIRLSWPMAALVLAIAAPEFLYLGLVYTPALLGLSGVVGAHLLARRAARGAGLLDARLWLSIALFGVGAACRWDTVAYGAVIVADLFFAAGASNVRARVYAVLWGVAALASWLLTITFNGYGPRTLLQTLRTAGPVESFPGLMVWAATIQTFATPAFVLMAGCGMLLVWKHQRALAVPVLVGAAAVARYAQFGVPKWFLVAAPGLAACVLIGFSWLWQRGAASRAAVAACLALPWIAGMQVLFGDTAYGPGFQVRPFDRPLTARSYVRASLGPGALVPTSEGPRPVGGHAWVLLGGDWRRNVREASTERERAIREAIGRGVPILQDLGEGYTVATLAGMRLTTRDSWKHFVGPTFATERRFSSTDGTIRVDVLRLRDRDSLFAPGGIAQLRELAGSDALVIYGYTSTLRRCYRLAPDALQSLGPSAALLDLDKLRAGAVKMTASASAPSE